MPTPKTKKPAARTAEPKCKSKPQLVRVGRHETDKIFFPRCGPAELFAATDSIFNHALDHFRQEDSRAGEMTRQILRMKRNGDDPEKLSALCRPIYAAVLRGILDTFKEDLELDRCSIEINLPPAWRDTA